MTSIDVGNEAEPKVGITVIEDQTILFPIRRPQPAPDDLGEQDLALGRAAERYAAHVPINPGSERAHVAYDLVGAAVELVLDHVALVILGEGVLIAARHTRRLESLLQGLGVGPVDREA